eukprot:767782-Hanusia_phi.AAC.5
MSLSPHKVQQDWPFPDGDPPPDNIISKWLGLVKSTFVDKADPPKKSAKEALCPFRWKLTLLPYRYRHTLCGRSGESRYGEEMLEFVGTHHSTRQSEEGEEALSTRSS